MSNNKNSSSSSSGIGFFGLLTVLFVALKLLGYIHWSWWFVLMPLYAIPVILLSGLAIAFVGAMCIDLFNQAKRKRRRKED